MLARIITLAIIIGAGWWYYNGPWQDMRNPSYEKRMQNLQEDMRLCIGGKNRKMNMTGEGVGVPEEVCAQEHNAYRGDDGQWYSYDDIRR